MDTSNLQKEDRKRVLTEHLDQLKAAKSRFEGMKAKSHVSDADKEKYGNKIAALDEQIKTTEGQLNDVTKPAASEAKATVATEQTDIK
jgi:predicted  nucleic acid-binding Zn-ribbon protein